jgi:hypothetical protein
MSDCNSVYVERDQLIAFLSRVFPSHLGPVDDQEPGWMMAVYIHTPEGQLSWHIPDHEAHTLFGHLVVSPESNWDGHTTEEKYERLSRLDGVCGFCPDKTV